LNFVPLPVPEIIAIGVLGGVELPILGKREVRGEKGRRKRDSEGVGRQGRRKGESREEGKRMVPSIFHTLVALLPRPIIFCFCPSFNLAGHMSSPYSSFRRR